MTATQNTQKIVLNPSRDIPFNKLVLSQANVRRVKAGVSIEALAESIARRSLLQSLSVRAVLDAEGNETGVFEVPAGGRRYRALELLVKQKRLARTTPIPCIVKTGGIAEEDSLAENTDREALHPLDQFRAFQALREKGQGEEVIAAAFGVTAAVVRQRLKLAAASPKLLDAYAEDRLTLDQLMAFCVSDDHARQEQVWELVQRGWNQEPYLIRRLLTEDAVRVTDKRARFVGIEAYEAAGGALLRDLFEADEGGWVQDPALLDRLAGEKLQRETELVRAEGWRWVEAAIAFPYGHTHGLRRIAPMNPLSQTELAEREALRAECEQLEQEYADAEELPQEVEQRLATIETALAVFDNRLPVFAPEEIARAGAFVSIDCAGGLRIERGYVRPEDEVRVAAEDASDSASSDSDEPADAGISPEPIIGSEGSEPAAEAPEEEGLKPIPERLMTELTRAPHARLARRARAGPGYGVPRRAARPLPAGDLPLRRDLPRGRGEERGLRRPGPRARRHAISSGDRGAPRELGAPPAARRRGFFGTRCWPGTRRPARCCSRIARRSPSTPCTSHGNAAIARTGARRPARARDRSRHGRRGLDADGRHLSGTGQQGAHPRGGARGQGRARRPAHRPSQEGRHGQGSRAATGRDRLVARAAAESNPIQAPLPDTAAEAATELPAFLAGRVVRGGAGSASRALARSGRLIVATKGCCPARPRH